MSKDLFAFKDFLHCCTVGCTPFYPTKTKLAKNCYAYSDCYSTLMLNVQFFQLFLTNIFLNIFFLSSPFEDLHSGICDAPPRSRLGQFFVVSFNMLLKLKSNAKWNVPYLSPFLHRSVRKIRTVRIVSSQILLTCAKMCLFWDSNRSLPNYKNVKYQVCAEALCKDDVLK